MFLQVFVPFFLCTVYSFFHPNSSIFKAPVQYWVINLPHVYVIILYQSFSYFQVWLTVQLTLFTKSCQPYRKTDGHFFSLLVFCLVTCIIIRFLDCISQVTTNVSQYIQLYETSETLYDTALLVVRFVGAGWFKLEICKKKNLHLFKNCCIIGT